MDVGSEPGSHALRNWRHERFAQAYAGECYGNATRAYVAAGFCPKRIESAQTAGPRLLRDVAEIRERVAYLRKAATQLIEYDRLEATRRLLGMAEDDTCPRAVQLKALQTLNKLMGYETPEEVHHEHRGELSVKASDGLEGDVLEAMREEARLIQEAFDAGEAESAGEDEPSGDE